MKSKLLFSVLLTTCLFASCGLIRKDTDDPTEKYYIKHPWGSGADTDWSWELMTKEGENYIYEGLWGGKGANINTKANDNGAYWFSKEQISGASDLFVGDGVKFTYYPLTETLSAIKTKTSSVPKAQVRFRKDGAYEYITEMSIEQVPGGGTGTFIQAAVYTFGESAGTSPYYDIVAQVSYPDYYDAYHNEWHFAFGNENPEYTFEEGKKYTYSCSKKGDSSFVFTITIDGTY